MDFSFWSALLILVKTCVYTSAFWAMGGVIFWLLFAKQAEKLHKQFFTNLYLAAFISIISSIWFLMAQVGYIIDDGFAGMFDSEMLQIFLNENIGTSLYMRVAGAVLLIGYLVLRLKILALLAVILMAASFAITGHATSGDVLYTSLLLAVHLLAVSFWFGALWPLYMSARHDNAAEMLEKFGKIAAYIVPILIVVGVLFALTIVPSFAALFTSSYGISLLIKIGIVAVLLALAALNKLKLVPAIRAQKINAVAKLRLVIKIEAVAFLLIFIVTAALTIIMTLPE